MLINSGSRLYTYTITRDFGFAPNPFHGVCTLATCKPMIRKAAREGDWIMGIGGATLPSVHRKCVFLMKISEKVSFNQYWKDERFLLKRPCRNGSLIKMIGDNIYHSDNNGDWIQENSHHSNADGSTNFKNLKTDVCTTDQVLVSNLFFYFGLEAISVDLESIGYKNGRGCKKTMLCDESLGAKLILNIARTNKSDVNMVIADPVQFYDSHRRVDQATGKII